MLFVEIFAGLILLLEFLFVVRFIRNGVAKFAGGTVVGFSYQPVVVAGAGWIKNVKQDESNNGTANNGKEKMEHILFGHAGQEIHGERTKESGVLIIDYLVGRC